MSDVFGQSTAEKALQTQQEAIRKRLRQQNLKLQQQKLSSLRGGTGFPSGTGTFGDVGGGAGGTSLFDPFNSTFG